MEQEIIKEIRRVYKEYGRIALSLFALFNFFLLEVKEKSQCQKNQRLTKISAKKSTSVPTDDLISRLYNVLFSFSKIQ